MKELDLLQNQANFLRELEVKGKSFNTLKNYKTDLNCFNKFLQERNRNLILKELTTEQVHEYGYYLDEKYNSPNSIRRRIQALRIFFDYLVANNIFPDNPIKKAVVSPKVVDIPRPVAFNQILNLYKAIEQISQSTEGLEQLLTFRNMVLIQLIYGGGLKVSDIAILHHDHLFLGNDGYYRVMINHPKKDPYTIKLPLNFSKLYTDYLSLLEKQKEKDRIDFSNMLFNSNPYKILSGGHLLVG